MRIKNLIVAILLFSGICVKPITLWNNDFYRLDKINLDSGAFQYKNSIQFELFGPAGIYSVDYERVLINKARFKTSARIGFGYVSSFMLPASINQIFSWDKHHLEMGVGHLLNFGFYPDAPGLWANLKIGYRYQKPTSKFLMKVEFTPFVEYPKSLKFHATGGIVFGYNF